MATNTRTVALLRRGLWLEYVTLGWNAVGVCVVTVAAILARSVALAGFALDSLIEIFASVVVVWTLRGAATPQRERRALRLIGTAFMILALYIAGQAVYVVGSGFHPKSSSIGIAWTAATLLAMLTLADGKARTGRALDNQVLAAEQQNHARYGQRCPQRHAWRDAFLP